MNSEVIQETVTKNTITKPIARLLWIDWMKVIGITLIVYGHFFSLYDIYVYVFSVPLFFLISGFLCKKESDGKLFWSKLFYNLMIPLLIICTVNYIIGDIRGFMSANHTLPENPLLFYGKMLIGIHGSVGAFWFVYTLIILKIILQYTKRIYLHLLWFVLFLVMAYVINNYDLEVAGKHPFKIPWSIPNTFVSYPFFIFGHFLRRWKNTLSNYHINKHTICWVALCLAVIFICGHDHKYVFLYECGYGDNFFLFLVGGLAGSAFVFFISKCLEKFCYKFIIDISIGTTIILGFHMHFITLCRHFVNQPSVLDAIFSILIVLTFVPIIRFCKTYVPILLGKYRVRESKSN